MDLTHDQRRLRAHVAHFAKRHGYADSFVYPVTVGEDRVDGDEVFAQLETPNVVYLFSLSKDAGTVDQFALYGEAATLAMLALTRLGRAVTRG